MSREPKVVVIELYVVVDADGDYSVGVNRDSAFERYSEDVNSSPCRPMRAVRVLVSVPCPDEMTLKGALPAEPGGEFNLTVQG